MDGLTVSIIKDKRSESCCISIDRGRMAHFQITRVLFIGNESVPQKSILKQIKQNSNIALIKVPHIMRCFEFFLEKKGLNS